MKPYPRYKPTGLAWLPSVPEHWEVEKGKHLFYKANRPVREGDDVVTCFRDGTVTLRKNRRTEGFTESLKEIGYQGIRKGDLVIHVMDAFAGSVGVSDSDGKATPVYSVCVPINPTSTNNYYYAFVVREMAKRGYIQALYRGIRERSSDFRFEVFGNQLLPLPPPSEQDRIVRYLDEKTAAIDELVRAKEREIELLRELIIWHAEDAMRTAPKARFRLKRFVRQIAEEITVEPARDYHPLGVLNRGRGLFHKEPVLGADLGDSTFFHVHPGDMIISGQFAWEGAVAMLEESERGCVASHRYPLVRSASDDLRLEYLWAFFQTHYGDMVLNLHSHGAAGRNRPLNFGELLDEYVPVPSLDRQEKIVDLVQKLSLVRRSAKAFKDRMVELRTRLVSDAVTGAVEV